ncbi:MAG TPA: hypothetical protein DD723_10015 [Candidatus Omnitrophica bacterium]|nr:MAG: hypothetical protein A2Z81_06125 [Omnitrophica WOR_2 bacterium GWA2_45_18]HBR15853.1 hypothetical protein [Candidatus Omnitrophota bacterium]
MEEEEKAEPAVAAALLEGEGPAVPLLTFQDKQEAASMAGMEVLVPVEVETAVATANAVAVAAAGLTEKAFLVLSQEQLIQ